jgi:hypothetical protein
MMYIECPVTKISENILFNALHCSNLFLPILQCPMSNFRCNQLNMTSPEKLIFNATIVSKIPSNVNREDIILQNDPSKKDFHVIYL